MQEMTEEMGTHLPSNDEKPNHLDTFSPVMQVHKTWLVSFWG